MNPPTTSTTDPGPTPYSPYTDSLYALAGRLRLQARQCEDDGDLLIAQAARERQRATLLRREADRVTELAQTTPEAPR